MENTPHDELLEIMKKQWELMGIDPSQMLKYMNNSQDMMRKIQKTYASKGGVINGENGDEDGEGLFSFESDEPGFKEESDITEESILKGIASGCNLAFLNSEYLNTLSTFKAFPEILEMLEADWGVESRGDLLETLEWLENEGHKKYFNIIWENLKEVPNAEWSIQLEGLPLNLLAQDEDDSINDYAENLIIGYQILKDLDCFKSIASPDILSWDLGRAINLVRWGYDVEFLTKDEAITLIQKYSEKLRNVYNSWESLSEGYLLGFIMWSGDEEELDALYDDHQVLLNHEKSPWVMYNW